MAQCSYIGPGVKGLLKDGGTARRAVVEKMIKAVGGKMEAYYYAFGEKDLYVIADLPDNATMAALSLIVSASGAVVVKTTVLLTPDELDQASKKSAPYLPPG